MANVSVTPINMDDQQQAQPQQPVQMVAATNNTTNCATHNHKCICESDTMSSTTVNNSRSVNNNSGSDGGAFATVQLLDKNSGSVDIMTVSRSADSANDVRSLDAEVAQIIQQQQHDEQVSTATAVPLRCKGTKPPCLLMTPSSQHYQQPRPMSWEGELSDADDKSNDVCMMMMDEDSSNDGTAATIQQPVHLPENLTVIHNNRQHDNTKVLLLQHCSNIINQRQKDQDEEQDLDQDFQTKRAPTTVTAITTSLRPSSTITPNQSPQLNHRLPLQHQQQLLSNMPATPSPDSAIHSTCYSVFSSPTQSPHTQRHISGSGSASALILTTPNLSRNNSDASHSSCCSYSSVSAVSEANLSSSSPPTHSPIQIRHQHHVHHSLLYRSLQDQEPFNIEQQQQQQQQQQELVDDKTVTVIGSVQPGISRQQLINSPCPICGDKISGFHYGIFSCESCKGFFKRTVQNRKNYVCLRGAVCPVTVATRKKCPACRFEKCLQCGMKLEAIREDRTRGGRSTYQCSYSLPPSMLGGGGGGLMSPVGGTMSIADNHGGMIKQEAQMLLSRQQRTSRSMSSLSVIGVPPLLQEIMDVEHLWHYSELELHRLSSSSSSSSSGSTGNIAACHNLAKHPLLAGTALGLTASGGTSSGTDPIGTDTNPDFVANLCNIADHRLYKIVKWCKSLPLFKNISIDDQILLLINSWCELLLFSCCYRSMSTPGEIRVSLGKRITLAQARQMGATSSLCIERMLNFTEQLRRLRVDRYEYVAMKVIVLLTSDTSQSDLTEVEKVRLSQEKALKALQDYTLTHYPDSPAKFGELLLRIPELQRTCQVGKEMLTIKSKDGDGPSFNLLMELLRGDH